MSKKIKLAVLISRTGRTLKNMIDAIKAGTLDAEIKLVVSSSSSARGLQYARGRGHSYRNYGASRLQVAE